MFHQSSMCKYICGRQNVLSFSLFTINRTKIKLVSTCTKFVANWHQTLRKVLRNATIHVAAVDKSIKYM